MVGLVVQLVLASAGSRFPVIMSFFFWISPVMLSLSWVGLIVAKLYSSEAWELVCITCVLVFVNTMFLASVAWQAKEFKSRKDAEWVNAIRVLLSSLGATAAHALSLAGDDAMTYTCAAVSMLAYVGYVANIVLGPRSESQLVVPSDTADTDKVILSRVALTFLVLSAMLAPAQLVANKYYDAAFPDQVRMLPSPLCIVIHSLIARVAVSRIFLSVTTRSSQTMASCCSSTCSSSLPCGTT